MIEMCEKVVEQGLIKAVRNPGGITGGHVNGRHQKTPERLKNKELPFTQINGNGVPCDLLRGVFHGL